MKLWIWTALAAAGAAGCAGVSKQDLDAVKAEMLANDAKTAAALKSELTGIDQKYVTVQQIENRVGKQLEEMAKLLKELQELRKELVDKVNLANSNVIKSLEFEEKLMSDRLAQLRLMIEELKKKPGQ
ncbi:MAG TPA: hypothetical protein VF950_23300 [Planctomycetota bacterium]